MRIIAVDFDGTCVKHAYPEIGEDIGAIPVLKAIVENGNRLILWTMRDRKPHPTVQGNSIVPTEIDCLSEAERWFFENGIALWGVNKNPSQTWSSSKKQFANYYIDDAALGCPLVNGHVDWVAISNLLIERDIITMEQYRKYATPDWLELCRK